MDSWKCKRKSNCGIITLDSRLPVQTLMALVLQLPG